MRKLIAFEIKKLLFNKKNWIIYALFCFFIILFIFSNNEKHKADIKEDIDYCEFLDNWYFVKAGNYNTMYDQLGSTLFKKFAEVSTARETYFNNKKVALAKKDKTAEIKAEIAYEEAQIEYFTWAKDLYEGKVTDDRLPMRMASLTYRLLGSQNEVNEKLAYYEKQEAFHKYLLKHNITPLNRYEMTGYNFIYLSMNQLFPSILVLVILLLLSDIVSMEKDMGSYKFLLLQPISRGKVILSKGVAASMVSLATVFGTLFAFFLLLGCINGFGSYNYPVLKSDVTYTSTDDILNTVRPVEETDSSNQFYINLSMEYDNAYKYYDNRSNNFYLGISLYSSGNSYETYDVPNKDTSYTKMYQFILLCLPVVAILIIFSSFFGVFLSTLLHNSLISLVFSILIGIAVGVGKDRILNGNIKKLLPFSYSDSVSLLNGTGGQTILRGILVIGLGCILILLLTHAIFRKKDILC